MDTPDEAAEVATWEVRGGVRPRRADSRMEADLLALIGAGVAGAPLRIEATPFRPGVDLSRRLFPRELPTGRPPEADRFLAEVAALVSPEALPPREAGHLGDALLAADVAADRAARLFLRAADEEVGRPERLAFRLAWAGYLGHDPEALGRAEELLARGAEDSWSAEAWTAIALAKSEPVGWDPPGAATAWRRVQRTPGSPWARPAVLGEAQAEVAQGEVARAIDLLKGGIDGEPDPGFRSELLGALVEVFEWDGDDEFYEGWGSYRWRGAEGLFRRLALAHAGAGRVESAVVILRRLGSVNPDFALDEELAREVVAPAVALGVLPPGDPLLHDLPRGSETRRALASAWRQWAAWAHAAALPEPSATERERLRAAYALALELEPGGADAARARRLAASL